MKNLNLGILAHVDSGKTTLSEAMLYNCNEIRTLGRVDHKNAFLDTNKIEKERGITIFSKEARMTFSDMKITLLDTPGHIDFSAETERVLSVLDYAVLVISGLDGVQSHTESLFDVLSHYKVPVFIFVNKMDMDVDKKEVFDNIRERFGDMCVDFSNELSPDFFESIAMCSENLMEEYLEKGEISKEAIQSEIKMRNIFPCFFGSALKNQGVLELLLGLEEYTLETVYPAELGGKVFKISEDERGQRLTHIKLTGGKLKVKEQIGEASEKINEIRLYSGAKFTSVQEISAGEICTLTGVTSLSAGDGFGFETSGSGKIFHPVFSYKINLPENVDINIAVRNLKKLEEEDSSLRIEWNPVLCQVHIQLMGEVQSEVLKKIILERFGMEVSFEESGIIYKETLKEKSIGMGHYEPLRHYAEVQLLLEPQKRGSGLIFKADCPEDELDKNWQRLILTHLEEKTHLGVLTGSPITDLKITLIAGRAHQKHTEGGDFRQATYRAVRHGLKCGESVLLEPWYSFRIQVPSENIGRVMTDIQNMGGRFSPPELTGDFSVLKGEAPVKQLMSYPKEIVSFTHGVGKISFNLSGYEECINQDAVIEEIGYNFDADTENTADSVFCSHGAGFLVRWDEAEKYMHIEKRTGKKENLESSVQREYKKITATDDELIEIFERTYGKIQRKNYNEIKPKKLTSAQIKSYKQNHPKEKKVQGEYLLVDGYNIIFSWYELEGATGDDLDFAKNLLVRRLSNYYEMQNAEIIVVFDAYKVRGGARLVERWGNISVVYTKEAETADSYIEKTSKELIKNYSVKVATSDRLEQIIIFGGGAVRISAEEFLKEIETAENKIREIINTENKKSAKDLKQTHEIKNLS